MEDIEPDWGATSEGGVFTSRFRLRRLLSIQGFEETTSGSSGARSRESWMERRVNRRKDFVQGRRGNEMLHQAVDNPN